MNMLRDMLQPPLRETLRSMFLEFGPSAVTVSFAETDDATTALFTADPAAGTLALVNALDAADFALDASTGVLTWAITPDYETQISHSVDISTTDGDGEVTLQRVTVRITPVSEFAPSFGATPTTVSVAEDISAATFFTPTITDADAGETITFALSGTHAALFTMDTTSGALRFTSAADFENGQGAGTGSNVYDVTITASDGTQSTAHGLQVTVTDVADEAPVFTSATSASTPENNTGVFYTAAATGDAGSAVTFAIQGGYSYAAAFSVNSTSGAVSFEAPGADFEVLASYTLPIVATDAAGNAATLSLAITVTDVDEIAPVFTSAAAVSVVENILGTVYTAVATDASAVTYSLAAGVQDNDLFAIDGSSGAVTFNSSPDFETPADADANNVYDLTITATDGSANASTLSVAITVTDVVETSVPTAYLDLDFASNSYRLADTASSFADALTGSSPKLTYATTSNSTMVDSSGNLVWAPHNLLTYSEDRSQGTTVEDATLSGSTLTATALPEGNQFPELNRTFTVPTGTTTWWADIENLTNVSYVTMATQLFNADALGVSVFELGATPNVATQGTNHTATITEVEAGVYRCSITFTTDGTDNAGRLALGMSDLSGLQRVVNPDGTESMDIVRQQLNRSDLGGMAPVPGAATGFEYYVPTNDSAEYLPRVGHHVYNGSAWVNEGLLLESEARTNLAASSNVFTTAGASTVTANSGVSPTGETNAVLAETVVSSASAAIFLPAFSAPAINTSITISCYVKDVAGSGILAFFFRSNAGINQTKVWFNLNTGTKGTQGANVGSTSVSDFDIADVGGGWYRLYVVGKDTNQTSFNPLIFSAAADNSSTRDANGEVLLFGAQSEAGATPSSYIPSNATTQGFRDAQKLDVPPAELGWFNYASSELVTNGLTWAGSAGNNAPTGWTKAGNATQYAVTADGALEIDRNFESPANTTQTITTEVGTTYRISIDYVATSSTNQALLVQVTGSAALVSETVNTLTTHSFEFTADSASTTIGIRPSSSTSQVIEIDNVSVREINPVALSFAMEGRMTHTDNAVGAGINGGDQQFYRWYSTNVDYIMNGLSTSGNRTGQPVAAQRSSTQDGVSGSLVSSIGGSQEYAPGVLVPYNVSARHSTTGVQGANDGTANSFTATLADKVSLADLSAESMEFGIKYMGTISHFRQWNTDIGETGIEEASS